MSFEVLAAPPGGEPTGPAKVRRVDDQSRYIPNGIPDELFEDIFFNLECVDRANFCVADPDHKLCLSDKHVMRCVLELLEDNDPNVVNSALKALGGLGSAAAEHVEAIAKKCSDTRFQNQALKTLAKLERHGTTDLVDTLKEYLNTPNTTDSATVEKKRAAIEALGHLGHQIIVDMNLVPVIEKIVADHIDVDHTFVLKSETIEMIGGLGTLAIPYVNKLANILKSSNDFYVREKVLKALIQLEKHGTKAFSSVFEFTSYTLNMVLYGNVRKLCFEALKKVGMTATDMKFLMDNMNEDRSYVLQVIFDDVKGTVAAELDIHYVVNLFKTTGNVESDSLRFLWGLKMLQLFRESAKPFVGSVVQMLKHDRRRIRDAAVEALEEIMNA